MAKPTISSKNKTGVNPATVIVKYRQANDPELIGIDIP